MAWASKSTRVLIKTETASVKKVSRVNTSLREMVTTRIEFLLGDHGRKQESSCHLKLMFAKVR